MTRATARRAGAGRPSGPDVAGRLVRWLLAVLTVALAFAAPIEPARAERTGLKASPSPPQAAVTQGDLRIERFWMRQPPPAARVGGGYATITNGGEEPDRLVGGRVDFAERFEIHEMAMEGGVMRMRAVEGGLDIPPGATVTLEPGGLHLMFMRLTAPPRAGDAVPVTLLFERAGEVTLDMHVAPTGARGPGRTH